MKLLTFASFLSVIAFTSCQTNSANKLIDEEAMIIPASDSITPRIEKPATESIAASNNQPSTGETLMKASDCFVCHAQYSDIIGPSFFAISNKYQNNDLTIEELANKIIKGGSGNWGNVQMQAHPTISKNDAEDMIRYILSIKK